MHILNESDITQLNMAQGQMYSDQIWCTAGWNIKKKEHYEQLDGIKYVQWKTKKVKIWMQSNNITMALFLCHRNNSLDRNGTIKKSAVLDTVQCKWIQYKRIQLCFFFMFVLTKQTRGTKIQNYCRAHGLYRKIRTKWKTVSLSVALHITIEMFRCLINFNQIKIN